MAGDLAASAPVRVLHLGSPEGLFGAERWILALIKHLPRDSVRSVVGVVEDRKTDTPAPLLEQARTLGFETVILHGPGRMSIRAVSALRRFILEAGIDIVHTHFYKSTLLGLMGAYGTSARVVATPHGWSSNAGMKLQAYEWAERVAFGWTDAVAPLSADLDAELRRLPWLRGRLRMIGNGVDLSEVASARSVEASVEAVRRRGGFVVGYLGQLIRRKRVATLLEAFASLPSAGKHLFIVGDGPDRGQLESLASSLGIARNTSFVGFRDDRLSFLRGFDVLVLPSEQEGIPRCLMEGMAAGVPIVATDIDGTRDLVLNERTGLTFQVGDSAALARCLERLYEGPVVRSELAERGVAHVNSAFTAEAMAKRYVELYADVMHSSRRDRGALHRTRLSSRAPSGREG